MTRVLVGTKGSEIYEIQIDTGSAADAHRIGAGHFKDELWGLASHPTDADLYATCGDDATRHSTSVVGLTEASGETRHHRMRRSCHLLETRRH